MSDSYFLRPHAGGPALEIEPEVSGHVLITTSPHIPRVVLDPSQVEEVCRVMYRYAGLAWPCLTAGHPCPTRFREGECAGTVGHAGECTVNADDIPSEQERPAPPADPSTMDLMPEIRSMVRRIETLEQGTADGAATDDMFVAQDKRITRLEERLHELRRAYTAHVDSPQHVVNVVSLLTEIRDRLPEPPPPVCGADNSAHGGDLNCELPAGHEGRHMANNASWPDRDGWTPAKIRCMAAAEHGARCLLPFGHPSWHSSGHHTWGQG